MITSLIPVARDAEDAVQQRDGYNYDGYTLRVEFPRGTGPGPSRGGIGPGGGGGGGRGDGGGGGGRRRGGPPSRRSEYRVLVSGKNVNMHFPVQHFIILSL